MHIVTVAVIMHFALLLTDATHSHSDGEGCVYTSEENN